MNIITFTEICVVGRHLTKYKITKGSLGQLTRFNKSLSIFILKKTQYIFRENCLLVRLICFKLQFQAKRCCLL